MPRRPPIRLNDAQTERLLQALRNDPEYRHRLAREIAEREGIQLRSAERRLQRYISEAEESRQLERSPVEKKAPLRREARELPRPTEELGPAQAELPRSERVSPRLAVQQPELDALLVWFDGDINAVTDTVGGRRELWDLVRQNVDLTTNRGQRLVDEHGPRRENLADFYDGISQAEKSELSALHDIFKESAMNPPVVEQLMSWLSEGKITADEIMDALDEDGWDLYADESVFWEWFRREYGKAKK